MPETGAAEWSEEAVLRRLTEIAKESLNLTREQVTAIDREAPLIETLRLDSLAQVVLVTNVEQTFACTLEPEDWQQLETVNDLVKLIAARAGGADQS
jgi:acyl carrier protein